MKINKKQLLNIIMIIIVIIAMVGFSFWVKQKIAKKNVVQNQDKVETVDIDLNPRPIEELFTTEFPDIEKGEILDQEKCNSDRILKDRDEKIRKGELENTGKLSLDKDCWRTYENDEYKFSFRDLNDSLYFSMEKNNNLIVRDKDSGKMMGMAKGGLTLDALNDYINDFNDNLKKLVKVRHYKNQKNGNIYIFHYNYYDWFNKKNTEQIIVGIELNKNFYISYNFLNTFTKDLLTTISSK